MRNNIAVQSDNYLRTPTGRYEAGLRTFTLSVLCAISLVAQVQAGALPTQSYELLAVTWDGPVFHIDAATAMGNQVGVALQPLTTNHLFLNALARDNSGRFIAGGSHTALYEIDPANGNATLITGLNSLGDIRGLAVSPSGALFAVEKGEAGITVDALHTIDLSTGNSTLVGEFAIGGLQALTFSQSGILYGYDVGGIGLVTIDPTTGAVTDVNPAISAGSIGLQSLAFAPGGRLIGTDQIGLYDVDSASGRLTALGGSGFDEVRGIEFIPIPEPCSILLAVFTHAMLCTIRIPRMVE